MGLIVTPEQYERRRQPQTPVGVNRASPLARGLVGSWTPHGYNHVAGRAAAQITAPRRGTRLGVALEFAGGAEIAQYDSYQPQAAGWTAVTLLIPGFASMSTSRQGIWHWQGTTGGVGDRLRLIWLDSTNGFYLDTRGGYAYTAQPSFSAGDVLLVGTSKTSGANGGAYYINGRPQATTEVSFAGGDVGVPATAVPLYLGDDVEAASGWRLNGKILLHAHWGRVLSQSEHAELARNPWQIFA